MATPDLNEIARRIDTGSANPETSRALVVFNESDAPVTGVAVFQAEISWPMNDLLPFIAVSDMEGNPVISDIPDIAEGPDPKGRADWQRLAFPLRFAVADVPPRGWRTYLAFYGGEIVAPDPQGLDIESAGLTVVETTRHGGDLPSCGTF